MIDTNQTKSCTYLLLRKSRFESTLRYFRNKSDVESGASVTLTHMRSRLSPVSPHHALIISIRASIIRRKMAIIIYRTCYTDIISSHQLLSQNSFTAVSKTFPIAHLPPTPSTGHYSFRPRNHLNLNSLTYTIPELTPTHRPHFLLHYQFSFNYPSKCPPPPPSSP